MRTTNKKKTVCKQNVAPQEEQEEERKENFAQRCARLRREAEAANDDVCELFYTAAFQAVSMRIPESLKETCLILLLNRRFNDFE